MAKTKHNYQCIPVEPLADLKPKWSLMYPLEPKGLGSSALESLSGYMCRLSNKHWMITQHFVKKVIKPIASKEFKLQNTVQSLYFINGYGKNAKIFSDAISKGTQIFDIRNLTFLPWLPILNSQGHGLLREKLHWCSSCWKEDINSGQRPYVRLSWTSQQVHVCTEHSRNLQSFCPHCGSSQYVVPRLPRPWICQSCGEDLYDQKKDKPISRRSNQQKFWAAEALENLIESSCAINIAIPENIFRIRLNELIDTFFLGDISKFSQYLQLNPRIITSWSTGTAKPSIHLLLDLLYRLDIPPDQFLLTENYELTTPENWRQLPPEQFVTTRKLSKIRRNQIRATLNKLIKENPEPPPLVSEISKSLDISYSCLNYNFPEEYVLLKKRADEWRNHIRTIEGKQRIEIITQDIKELSKLGIYPSDRKLREFGYVRASELRNPKIIEVIRELQNTAKHSELDIKHFPRNGKKGDMHQIHYN